MGHVSCPLCLGGWKGPGLTHPGEDGSSLPCSSPWKSTTAPCHSPQQKGKGKPTLGGLRRVKPCPARARALGLAQQQPAQLERGCERSVAKHQACSPRTSHGCFPPAWQKHGAAPAPLPPRTPPSLSPLLFHQSMPVGQPGFFKVPQTGAVSPTWPKRWEGAVLVQPCKRCLGEALHAGCGDHAVERLEQGPDDDTELMGAEELRTSLAKTMVSHLPGVDSTLLQAAGQTSLPGCGANLLGAFLSTAPPWAPARTAGVMGT